MKAAKNIGGAGFAQRKSFYVLLAVVAATQLSACSKTVQWEEEVPLNTGETIWVKRTDSYVRSSEPGNPLKMGWRIEDRAIDFSHRRQHFRFHTDTTEVLMLYELDAPTGLAIVAWTKNCQKWGYGEFHWRDGSWQLQKDVNPALIGQPRNLMSYFSADESEIPARVTKEIRSKEDSTPNRGTKDSSLELSRIAINCSGGK